MIKKVFRRIALVAGDRRWWGFYFQRRFLHPRLRQGLARFVARHFRPAAPTGAATEAELRSAAELSSRGIAMLGELLPPQACSELRAYFESREVFDPYRPGSVRFLPNDTDKRHPDAHIAHHEVADVLRAPHLLDLANDPRILRIVTEFLGCKPTIGYLAVWWSYATGKGAQQAEFFHRDVDDWKFVKLFVYLSDVGAESGPHMYVQNSSADAKLAEIRRFSDDEVRSAFGQDNILTMVAPAGQGFLEDTFGIHKGQPVAAGTRLIFQAVYGYSELPYGPKAPVTTRSALGRDQLDHWVNRVYLR